MYRGDKRAMWAKECYRWSYQEKNLKKRRFLDGLNQNIKLMDVTVKNASDRASSRRRPAVWMIIGKRQKKKMNNGHKICEGYFLTKRKQENYFSFFRFCFCINNRYKIQLVIVTAISYLTLKKFLTLAFN